jgi:hypothetical protein
MVVSVTHMALLYLVHKPQVLGKIMRWLFFFLEYNFLIIYKLARSHYVVDALTHMPDLTKQNGVSNQTTYVIIFLLQLVWLHEIFKYFITEFFSIHYS